MYIHTGVESDNSGFRGHFSLNKCARAPCRNVAECFVYVLIPLSVLCVCIISDTTRVSEAKDIYNRSRRSQNARKHSLYIERGRGREREGKHTTNYRNKPEASENQPGDLPGFTRYYTTTTAIIYR